MRKLNVLVLMSALFLLLPAFVGCNKDDDDNDPIETDGVIGTYTGNMIASVTITVPGTGVSQSFPDIAMPETYEIKISKMDNGSGRVVLDLPECSYVPPMSDQLETISALTIDNVAVVDEGNGLYSLDKDEYTTAVDGVQYTLSIEDYDSDDKSGTLIAGRDIKLVYDITPGKMPGFIRFTFTGTLK